MMIYAFLIWAVGNVELYNLILELDFFKDLFIICSAEYNYYTQATFNMHN